MRRKGFIRGLPARVERALGTLLVLGMVALVVLVPTAAVTIEETSKSEFCRTCHIMEPYYDSWLNSSHNNVACIDCHYEPGAVETVGGKFQAMSQLAKYVTQTQGTKPWAEVSDLSCMRSGCHSVRLLEGRIEYGDIKFDHRHHLLESRRGRRLRCTSCHSQIVQGDHLNVTESVCFMCHFKSGDDPQALERTSDCLVCHGPPEDVVEVAGRPFDHQEYLARGVDCRECHNPVVRGEGTVRRERCHSCHGEAGHIERFEETEFLHEQHVTEKKVECFECHDEIEHGLLPLSAPKPATSEGCGACHVDSHDANRMMYAGTGAIGVPDRPSRMYETRVVCDSCHTGRSGSIERASKSGGPVPASVHQGQIPEHALGSSVAKAGAVDCIHCHGTGFDGMLESWQSAVGEQLAQLGTQLQELDARIPAANEDPARILFEEARRNVLLVELDGSRGAHNVLYALDTLRAGAERLQQAQVLLGSDEVADLTLDLPFVSANGCSECHLGVERAPAPLVAGRAFPHDSHLAAGLDCQSCHSTTEHGAPTFPRNECGTCHHTESEDFDVYECSTCHATQNDMLLGTLAGFEEHPSVMAEMECSECHGDPPDLMLPPPAMCVLCHEAGYDEMMGQWQGTVSELTQELEALRTSLATSVSSTGEETRAAFAAAEEALGIVEADGSRGIHNVHLTLDVLAAAREQLEGVSLALGASAQLPAAPLETEEGCSTCHVGFERTPALLPDGGEFPHRRHVLAGLDCSTCHSVEDHGQPAFARSDCASCHHQENERFDVWECGTCHARQENLLAGVFEDVEFDEAPKGDLDCDTCHGEPPDLGPPEQSVCKLCHGDEVEEVNSGWSEEYEDLRGRLTQALASPGDADSEAVARAQRILELVNADGSGGVHNSPFTRLLLEQALDGLR